MEAGNHEQLLENSRLKAGTYIVHLQTDTESNRIKVILTN
jgi:hypothetical protein